MRHETFKQFLTVNERDAKVFEEALNQKMRDHASKEPEAEIKIFEDHWCGVISYIETVEIPESLWDEFRLEGIDYRCGDCPYFELPNDKRVKFIRCEKDGSIHQRQFTSPACEWLLEQVKRGEVKI